MYPDQDGDIASLCPHGFAEGECLICKTLPATSRPAVQPDALRSASPPAGRGRSFGSQLALAVAGIVAIGLVAWLIAGTVVALLHTLELVAVAVVAGWLGYRIGRHRGRRER